MYLRSRPFTDFRMFTSDNCDIKALLVIVESGLARSRGVKFAEKLAELKSPELKFAESIDKSAES